MVLLSRDKIKDIAGEIDCGFICYINTTTGEHITIPKDYEFYDSGGFDDNVREVKKNRKRYLVIEPPMPSEAFKIMEGFIDTLPEHEWQLRVKLIEALNKRKPFQNFKYVIDNAGPYRQHWFDYKNQQLIEFVKENLPLEAYEK